MQTKLSALWIFVLFNIVFRDIHDFFRPGAVKEIQTGVVNGNQITDELMLLGAVLVEIPILMVLLSSLFRESVIRWTNLLITPWVILISVLNGVRDLDDMFFLAVQIISMLSIFWFAWRWDFSKNALNPKIN